MPAISVIVPVYNVEAYLDNCINTILKQSFKDFELILVDDGSEDNSLSICEKYQELDARIIVLKQANKGVSEARNKGLAVAKGNYLLFVDGDDYLHEQMLEQLYTLTEQAQADLAICGFKVTSSLKEPFKGISNANTLTLTKEEALQNFLYPKKLNFGISIWNKLFRRSCVEDLHFDSQLQMNEDKYFLSQALCKASSVLYTSEILYFYYQRPDSVSKSKNYKKWLDCVRVSEAVYEDILGQYPKLELYARCQLVDMYYFVFNMLILLKPEGETDLLAIKTKLAKLNLKELNAYLSLKQIISVTLILNLPLLVYKYLANMIDAVRVLLRKLRNEANNLR